MKTYGEVEAACKRETRIELQSVRDIACNEEQTKRSISSPGTIPRTEAGLSTATRSTCRHRPDLHCQ
eukprot:1237683-Pleurochrysis_carterae.AAC.1